jgi:FkbM family methyltransferase
MSWLSPNKVRPVGGKPNFGTTGFRSLLRGVFHSEHGQDRWLAQYVFANRRDGTFVEFGALDGVFHSNSLFFERERGWRGLLIEPHPALFETLQRNRPLAAVRNVAIAGNGGEAEFVAIEGNLVGWSGLGRTIEPGHRARIAARHLTEKQFMVPCITLDQALTDAGLAVIDYLSIDVEGAEIEILKDFPFDRYRIEIVGVEDNFGRPELDRLLMTSGYDPIGQVGPDKFYQRR